MAAIFPAQAKIHPSYSVPENIVTYAQASGFMSLMAGGAPRVQIGDDDLAVYVNRVDVRTEAQAAEGPGNWLPSPSIEAGFEQAMTYLLRVRSVYDRHDMAAAGRYDVALPQAYEMAGRQGIFQQLRTGFLYGFNAANGEGLMNISGATNTTLPTDPYGNTTVLAYDAGAMYQFLLQQYLALKTRMYQSGGAISNRVVILSPQRVFLTFQLASVVQLTSYQRPGGGTNTVAGTMQKIAEEAGDTIEWFYDDTLIGKGSGGSDAVMMVIPEIEVPDIGKWNTNEFGQIKPATKAVTIQYSNVVAPIKIDTPTPDGAITSVLELRATPGWCWRPQGLTILSMPY